MGTPVKRNNDPLNTTRRILVVEDNADIALGINAVLKLLGFNTKDNVIFATTKNEAIECFEKAVSTDQSYDLMICDNTLVDEHGVRAQDAGQEVLLHDMRKKAVKNTIFSSGEIMGHNMLAKDVAEALKDVHILPKIWEIKDLEALLSNLFPQKEPAKQVSSPEGMTLEKSMVSILLVDSMPELLTMLKYSLAHHGFNRERIHIADSASEAKAQIAATNFDVLISGDRIPHIGDGKALLLECPQIPARFIHSGSPEYENGINEDPKIGSLPKPMAPLKLAQAIESALSGGVART